MSKSNKLTPWQSSKKPSKYVVTVGDIYGRWTVIGNPSMKKPGGASGQYWPCRCVCGHVQECRAANLIRGLTKSCGCYRPSGLRYKTTQELTGRVFDRWTVLNEDAGRQPRRWFCQCRCGTLRSVQAHRLLNNASRSCGCLNRDITSTRVRAHGLSHTVEYEAWSSMLKRCTNPKTRAYGDYGGRGIGICEAWLGPDGFMRFLTDLGRKPSPQHTLERNDKDGDYEAGNCRWATRHEQNRNKRNNVFITFNGVTLCRADWARKTGLKALTIRLRLERGWTPEKALTTPVRGKN